MFTETEGRSLQEIELFFSNKERPITNRYITKIDLSQAMDEGEAVPQEYDNKAYSA